MKFEISVIKDKIREYFSHQEKVICVYLFGSTAKSKENKFSDVDIAVLFDAGVDRVEYTRRCLSITDELSRILDKDIDVVDLNEAASFLKFHIIKEGIKVYERPCRIEHNFEARTIVEYLDFLPIRRKLEAALITNIRGL